MAIGVAAPITGAASSIGVQQFQLGAVRGHPMEQGRSSSSSSCRATRSCRTPPRRSGRRRQSPGSALGWSPARREPGGQDSTAPYKARRARVRLGLRDADVAHRRLAGAATSSASSRRTASRARPSPSTSQHAEARKRLHHRRPGDVPHGPRRRGPGVPAGPRGATSRVTRSASRRGLLVARSRRSRATQVVYIPWQLAAQGAGVRPAAQGAGQEREAVRVGRLFDRRRSRSPARTSRSSRSPGVAGRHGVRARRTAAKPTSSARRPALRPQVVVRAVEAACADGKITRAEVRAKIAAGRRSRAKSILGLPIASPRTVTSSGGSSGSTGSRQRRRTSRRLTLKQPRAALVVGRTRLCEPRAPWATCSTWIPAAILVAGRRVLRREVRDKGWTLFFSCSSTD